jgi:hypothetical protein
MIHYNQGSPRATNNHNSDKTSTAVHNTNRVAKKPKPGQHITCKKLPKSHANLSRAREMCSAERKPNLAQAISTKAQDAKERPCGAPVFQAPPKGAALGSPGYRIGEWRLVMVPLRRWRGGFELELCHFLSRRQSCELTRISHVRARELAYGVNVLL